MQLIDKTVYDYINDVDSISPYPGGGSVAALVGALGASLCRMEGHFSVEKKKFLEASKSKQDKFILAFKELEYYKDLLVNGIDDDAVSYGAVVDAFKSKDEEQIQSALLTSCLVAYEMQTSSVKALSYVNKLIELGNKNLYSDLISGAILLQSANEMAALNVVANAKSFKDEKAKEMYLKDSQELIKKGKSLKNKAIKMINNL